MIREGIIVAVHPSRRTVDLVDMHSGQSFAEVGVLAHQLSSDGGEWSVPSVTRPPNQQSAAAFPPGGRRMIAAYSMGPAGRPVILGFRQPAAGEVVVTDQDRYLWRKNGVVETVDAAGNYQLSMAGGVTVRVGTPEVEDISGVAANQNWSVPAGAPATLTIEGPNWSLVVDSSGNPTLTTTGDITVNCKDAKVQASGSASVLAATSVVLGAAGGKRVVVDGDPVSTGGTVQATQTRVTAA